MERQPQRQNVNPTDILREEEKEKRLLVRKRGFTPS